MRFKVGGLRLKVGDMVVFSGYIHGVPRPTERDLRYAGEIGTIAWVNPSAFPYAIRFDDGTIESCVHPTEISLLKQEPDWRI